MSTPTTSMSVSEATGLPVSSSIETLPGLKRRVQITIPLSAIEPIYNERLRKLAQTAKVDGFRPGKVPLAVLKRQVGSSLWFEIAQELVKEQWPAVLEMYNIRVVGTPTLIPPSAEQMNDGHDLPFFIECEIYPDIQLPDFSAMSLHRLKAEVTDADIDAELVLLRRQEAEWKSVERPAAVNDRLHVEINTYFKGVLFEPTSGTALNIDLDESPCKSPFNAIQQILLGSVVGDEREVQVSVPQSDGSAVQVLLKCLVRSVSEPVLPELDDTFAARIDKNATNVSDLRADLAKKMQVRVDRLLRNRLKSEVVGQLLSACRFELPQALLEIQSQETPDSHQEPFADSIRSTLAAQFSRMDVYLMPQRLPEERLRAGLILSEVIQQNQLKCQEHHIHEEIEKMAILMGEDFSQVLAAYSKRSDVVEDIAMGVLEDLAIKKILEKMQVDETVVHYSEIVRGR